MVRRYYDLPSLTTLAIFEASARHLSFKLAAAELNVTPGAVSKQIKAIEDELGVPLFVRRGTGVTLTSAGEDLYGVLSGSFSRAAEVVRTIKRGDRSKNVTIACTDALATMWLIPRMADFWERFPEITVDHLISDNPRDYRRAEVELRVRYGLGAWADETAELLFDDTIYPVCGPGFARRHRNVTPEALPDLPLLHVDWVDPEWPIGTKYSAGRKSRTDRTRGDASASSASRCRPRKPIKVLPSGGIGWCDICCGTPSLSG